MIPLDICIVPPSFSRSLLDEFSSEYNYRVSGQIEVPPCTRVALKLSSVLDEKDEA